MRNYFFLKNYVTSEGAVAHNVLDYCMIFFIAHLQNGHFILYLQETDFLGVVFHMYEKDQEDSDAGKTEKDVLSSSKMAKQR